MNVIKKIVLTLVVIIVLAAAAVAIAAKTVDIDQYRGRIADALSKQLGRAVTFGGPIHLAMSWHGIGVDAESAAIGNPAWASRPQMASIGKLQLGVALMPLLSRQIVVSELDISNADILLETNASGQHNWDMKPQASAPSVADKNPGAPPSSAAAAGVRIDELSIMNSQLAMRDKDGKISTFKVDKMTLALEGRGTVVAVNASYNGTPIKLNLKADTGDLLGAAQWPFNADLDYGNDHLTAQGNANIGAKTVELASYELTAGSSSLHGQMTLGFGGAKTDVHGTVLGDKLDLADLGSSPPPGEHPQPANANQPPINEPAPAKPLFSTAPLDVSALKSADAAINVTIGQVVSGKMDLKQVSGNLTLANGNLAMSPLKAMLGNSALTGDVKLEGTVSPAQYSVSFKAPGVDIADLLQMLGTQAFMTGKGDADIELSGAGNSLHDMAAGTNGHIVITAEGGTISSAAAGGVAAGLAQILAPGNASPTLNCVAVRFNVANGVGKDDGILADSSASTVAGSGGFNLGTETVDLTLDAKPKVVNTHGLTPSVKITGPLASPKVNVDTAALAQNVAGALMKGKGKLGSLLGSGNAESSVPAMQTPPAGQNACIYTLDHKAATAAAPQNNAVKDVAGQAASKAKSLGNQLMKGLLGH